MTIKSEDDETRDEIQGQWTGKVLLNWEAITLRQIQYYVGGKSDDYCTVDNNRSSLWSVQCGCGLIFNYHCKEVDVSSSDYSCLMSCGYRTDTQPFCPMFNAI